MDPGPAPVGLDHQGGAVRRGAGVVPLAGEDVPPEQRVPVDAARYEA